MGFIRRSKKEAAGALRKAIGEFELPQFPGTTLEAMSTLRNQDSTLIEIADTLSVDPGLSVRILSLVNSSAFGLRAPIDDLSQAVSLVGRSQLEAMLISVGVRQALPQDSTGFDGSSFWKAASFRAAVARRLSELICPMDTYRAFTAALLQDMAVPLLADRRGADYRDLLDGWRTGGPALPEREHDAFGGDHAEVGLLMCQVWDLPESLSIAIAGHHEAPAEAVDVPAPVLLSSCLREYDFAPGIEEMVEAAQDRHALEHDCMAELVDASYADAEDLAQQFA